MMRAMDGVFRHGRVELSETPEDVEGVRVIVTFLKDDKRKYLSDFGISPEEAADLRARFATFAEDWDSPEMDGYDEL